MNFSASDSEVKLKVYCIRIQLGLSTGAATTWRRGSVASFPVQEMTRKGLY